MTDYFYVINSNTLVSESYGQSVSRHELFDLSGSFDIGEALREAGSVPPINDLLYRLFDEFKDQAVVDDDDEDEDYEDDAEDGTDAAEPEAEAVQAPRRGIGIEDYADDPDNFSVLYDALPSDAQRDVDQRLRDWAESEPESEDWEYGTNESADPQREALEFFRALDPKDRAKLGVVIVEGDRPGSSYYAAELRMSVEAANEAAEAAGIDVEFELEEAEQ